jgi:hypothetical protein
LTDAHNPDVNPDWTPLLATRRYVCRGCGAEREAKTNHTGSLPAERCVGRCRTILNAHTAREIVRPFFGPHDLVEEAPTDGV